MENWNGGEIYSYYSFFLPLRYKTNLTSTILHVKINFPDMTSTIQQFYNASVALEGAFQSLRKQP